MMNAYTSRLQDDRPEMLDCQMTFIACRFFIFIFRDRNFFLSSLTLKELGELSRIQIKPYLIPRDDKPLVLNSKKRSFVVIFWVKCDTVTES